ncbi:MAG: carboxypeptidase-like regulatory domain-containing protein [Planctomycetota bacterium]|nr:carboxypeptidase-like regulatory domain-containing protein [Planctomycetota bacterium]
MSNPLFPRRATIAGTAIARNDQTPLSRTRIRVVLEVLPGGKVSREVVTDDVGRFEIPVEWEGPSAVEIYYHALADGRGVIDGHLSEGTGDCLTPVKVVDGGRYETNLSFPDGYSLEVAVTDPDGCEVEGASVALSLFMEGGMSMWPLYQLMGRLTTDAAGRAVVPGLWATPATGERYVVAVEHAPYCAHLIADPEDLPRPGGMARAAVGMQRGVSLRVATVSEADGTPIVGAKVCVFAPVDLGRGLQSFVEKSGFTAAGGECEVGGLRSGDYGVFVTGKGFLPARQDRVPVGSVDQAELKMIPAGRITGHVVDQRGNPVSGASVQGEVGPVNAGEPFMDMARTDPLGAFALESLPKGRRALVSASLHEAPHTFFGAVAADTTDSDITLDARAMVRCTLRVLDAKTNRPVAGVVHADIVVEPDKGHVFYRAEAANGECSFPLVPGMESEITAHDSFLPNDSQWFATARVWASRWRAGSSFTRQSCSSAPRRTAKASPCRARCPGFPCRCEWPLSGTSSPRSRASIGASTTKSR